MCSSKPQKDSSSNEQNQTFKRNRYSKPINLNHKQNHFQQTGPPKDKKRNYLSVYGQHDLKNIKLNDDGPHEVYNIKQSSILKLSTKMRGSQCVNMGEYNKAKVEQQQLQYKLGNSQNSGHDQFLEQTANMFPFMSFFSNKLGSDLSMLVKIIEQNNKIISKSFIELQEASQMLQKTEKDLYQNLNLCVVQIEKFQNIKRYHEPNLTPFNTNKPLITKLFQRKKFNYKLKLEHRFPSVIYKDRKISIKIKLINPDGNPICNANLINLCIGACDSKGEWILGQNGEFYIQGKIQVQLYHGQGEFKKIHAFDISRRYSTEGVNIIVYPKQSLINFTGETLKHQRIIDTDLIEPLIIHDVIVKAKKKTIQ